MGGAARATGTWALRPSARSGCAEKNGRNVALPPQFLCRLCDRVVQNISELVRKVSALYASARLFCSKSRDVPAALATGASAVCRNFALS
jgi:hypothetical protein